MSNNRPEEKCGISPTEIVRGEKKDEERALCSMSPHFPHQRSVETGQQLAPGGKRLRPFEHLGRVSMRDSISSGALGDGVNHTKVIKKGRKVVDRFTYEQKKIMKEWIEAHNDHPYPTQTEKNKLSILTGITFNKVSIFFNNYRSREWGAKEKKELSGKGDMKMKWESINKESGSLILRNVEPTYGYPVVEAPQLVLKYIPVFPLFPQVTGEPFLPPSFLTQEEIAILVSFILQPYIPTMFLCTQTQQLPITLPIPPQI